LLSCKLFLTIKSKARTKIKKIQPVVNREAVVTEFPKQVVSKKMVPFNLFQWRDILLFEKQSQSPLFK